MHCANKRSEAVVKLFFIFFWMRFSRAPLCRNRFNAIFDDSIFLNSGKFIEYI